MLAIGMSEHEQRFELLADLGAMIAGEVELDDLLATFAARASSTPACHVEWPQPTRAGYSAGVYCAS